MNRICFRLFGLGMILLVSTPAPAQNFHNQLVSNSGYSKMIPHAVQMGYDYTQQPGAHSAGLKQIIYLAADQVALRLRDGSYLPQNGMTAAQIAEYDQYACIRDPNTNDPTYRYYIEWVNPGPGGQGISLMFYINYQSKATLDASIGFYQRALDWGNIDGVMLDQVDYDFGYFLIPSTDDLASQNFAGQAQFFAGQMTACANPGDNNFSIADGFTYYVRALRDMFHSHNAKVAANVYDVSGPGQTIHSTFGLDHYYNESGVNNDASTFGTIPPDMVTITLLGTEAYSFPYPYIAGYDETLSLAALAAKQGSWYGSFSVVDFAWVINSGMNAIQLLHAMPNWDNLVGATSRSWNGAVYSSSNSYADSTVVYSRHPKTGKLFVVFRSGNAVLPLRTSETVVSVSCVDDLFIERGDCAGHFAVNDSEVRLTGPGQLNEGYIVEVR